MTDNVEGFLYPELNGSICIKCGLCERVCPIKETDNRTTPISVFAAQYKNSEALLESSSGGMFSALAEYALSRDGLVAGCVFDETFTAVHILTANPARIARMRGSKYVQSDLRGVYPEIRTALDNGRFVLFTGTPCQVDGLFRFLGKPYSNLFTVDLICHGVPSPKLLSGYLRTASKNDTIDNLKFRDKKRNGWNAQGSITLDGKVKTFSSFNSSYYYYFMQNSIHRMCCYSCKYSSISRVGDLTIGDYWNIDEILPELDSRAGFSALLVNTERGREAIEAIKDNLTLYETTLEDCVSGNGNLSHPSPLPDSRNVVYKTIENEGYRACEKKFFKPKRLVPFIKRHTPKFAKQLLKKLLSK